MSIEEQMPLADLITHHCRTTSIPFGPKGCPEARMQLVDMWQLPGVHQAFFEAMGGYQTTLSDGTIVGHDQDRLSTVRGLAMSDLYWVAPEMCGLINMAEPSVPTDVSLLQELLPSMSGLVFLAAKRTACIDTLRPEIGRVHVDAFSWDASYIVRGHTPHAELQIQSYAYHGTPGVQTKWGPVGQSSWPLGERIDYKHEHDSELDLISATEDRRLVISFLALIKSPGITNTVIEHPDRAATRRLARRGLSDNKVRVIYLRSPRAANGESPDEADRYHHRWIVSGHWRSQPYGPKRAHRKPVWIAPHVKGPDGAPMLHGEKVRAVVR